MKRGGLLDGWSGAARSRQATTGGRGVRAVKRAGLPEDWRAGRGPERDLAVAATNGGRASGLPIGNAGSHRARAREWAS